MAEKPKTTHEREQLYSTGEGKHRDNIIPTVDITQVGDVNLTGKVSDASGTAEVVSGTASAKSIITRHDYGGDGEAFFDLNVAGNTVDNDRLAGDGEINKKQPLRDGGIAVVPDGSEVTVNAYPDGTATVTSNVRMVPIQ